MKNSIKTSSVFRLVESKDKEGREWDVVIIQPGLSKNNKFYSKEVLKKALPLFENLKAFAYEFKGKVFNHLPEFARSTMPQGFVKNLAGWYDNIRYGNFKDENGEVKEGVLGTFHATAQWLKDFLKETWEHGKEKMLGISIDGGGKVEREISNGREIDRVLEINNLTSADPVTNEAAGGGFLRLVASMNEGGNEMNFIKKLIEMLKEKHADLVEGIDSENVTDEQFVVLMETAVADGKVEEILKEGFVADAIEKLLKLVKDAKALAVLKDLSARLKKYGYPYPAKTQASEEEKKDEKPEEKKEEKPEEKKEDSKEMKEMKEAIAKMERENALAKSQAILSEVLAEAKLLEPVKEKIRKQFADKIFKKDELQEAIKIEKDVLAKLSESGNVKGLGQSRVEVTLDEGDKFQVAMDKMVDDDAEVPENMKNIPGFTSLKEAYRVAHPEDPNITGNIDRMTHTRRLTEAITTADFTYALGTSMTRKLVKEFKVKPFAFDPIVTEVPVTNFKQQERVKWGGYSTLPAITEDAAYVDLYEPKDEEATYTPATKGGYVSVSRKTLKNDDLNLVRRIPSMIGRASRRTLERDVASLLLANGTYTPTNSTVFSTLFGNYSTSACGYDNITTAKTGIREQKERGAAQDSGTADGDYATTTLSDSSKAWTVNEFAGYYVRLVYGTGAGQMSLIASNTATKLTFAAITTQPDATTKYEISTAKNDDEQVGLEAKYIIYGSKLQHIIDALKSEKRFDNNENEINIHRDLKPIYCPYIAGSTYQYYWYLTADKTQIDMIEVGYVDNQRTPVLVLQDQPALGEVFTNDRIRYKVRFEYGLEIIENKGIYANEGTSV